MVTTLVGVAQISMANGMWLNCSVKGSVCGLVQYGISRYSVLASLLHGYAVSLANCCSKRRRLLIWCVILVK